MKRLIKLIYFIMIVNIWIGIASADITYSGSTISVTNQNVSMSDIYNALDDTSLLENTSEKYWILKKNLCIDANSALYINNSDTTELRLLSLNDPNVVVVRINGRLEVNNTKITSWNTSTNLAALNTDKYISYFKIYGENSSADFRNSGFYNLGYSSSRNGIGGWWEGGEFSLGEKSLYVDNVSFTNIYGGLSPFGLPYSANGIKIKNTTGLNYLQVRSGFNDSIVEDNSIMGGAIFTDNSNITFRNNILTNAGWNGFVFDGIHNSVAYGNDISQNGHNSFQVSTPYGTSSSYEIFLKNNTAHDPKGGTGGSNGFYLTWYGSDYPGRVYDVVIEDCDAYNFTNIGSPMTFDGANNVTVRRYRTWNVTGKPDISMQQSSDIVIIDSNLSGLGLRGIDSDNIKVINTKFSGIFGIEGADITTHQYLDVLVRYSNGTLISGATVDIPPQQFDIMYHSVTPMTLEITPINLHSKIIEVPIFKPKLLKTQSINQALTGEDGHIPLPEDEENTLVLPEYRVERGAPYYNYKVSVIDFTYNITASKNGINTRLSGITPDSSWYREDPNVPTYTITAIIPDEGSAGPDITGFAPAEDNPFNTGDSKIFRIWTDELLTSMNWYLDGTLVSSGSMDYTWTVTDSGHTIEFEGSNANGAVSQTWDINGGSGIAPPSSVSIIHATQTVAPNTPFTLTIPITPATPIAGAQFDLLFTNSLATVTTVTEGNLLNQDGATTLFNSGTIDNAAGTVTNIYGSILGATNVSSQGSLATISITAGSNTGYLNLNLSNVVISDANSAAVPYTLTNATILVDTAPMLDNIGAKSVDEENALAFTASASDADGDSLTYSASGLPAGASFNTATGAFSWIPADGQAGT
ncbi:hypothetical protein KAT92_05755, partial [Candidatus Babeliales bacterium]|nr:hypothetical protein [Candidatus Babeliales bacterium]